MFKNRKGITLIALIITIIVLLILAGISISLVVGDNGVLTRTKTSKEKSDIAQIQEEIQIAWSAVEADGIPNKWDNETKANALSTELLKEDENASATWNTTDSAIDVIYKGYGTTINLNNGTMTALEENGSDPSENNQTDNSSSENNQTDSNPSENNQIDSGYFVKYAVQIYGINQDVDSSDNVLGLTFGPATGENFNNSYVTHSYKANDSGTYDVMIITHSIKNNGTETISSVPLKNSSGITVTRTEEEKNKYDINIHNMTWEQIKAEPDKTKFTDCMLCGDTKCVKIYLNETVKSENTYTQNGDGVGCIKYTIDSYFSVWNPSTTQNENATNGGTSGSSGTKEGGYSSSHIRATLIGTNSQTDITYAGDNNLSELTCLYNYIQSDLKNIITAKKIKYVTGNSYRNYQQNDNISDKIWLFSEREICGDSSFSGETAEGLGESGDCYEKFKNIESNYYLSSYDDSETTKRKAWCENDLPTLYWLRSTYLIGRCLFVCGLCGWPCRGLECQ